MSLPPWRASKRWWHGYSNTHKVQGCIGEGDRQSMCLCLLGWDPYSRVRRLCCCSHCYLQVTVYPLCIFLLSFLLKSILLRRFSTACLGVQLEGRLVRLAACVSPTELPLFTHIYTEFCLFHLLTRTSCLSIRSIRHSKAMCYFWSCCPDAIATADSRLRCAWIEVMRRIEVMRDQWDNTHMISYYIVLYISLENSSIL